jgi:ectoine hydroxylase-related dioxygenase (phytanoyl-CoA dioxygenase family)
VTPESGDLLLWNSYLPHGYNNDQLGDRISISFNMISTEFSSGIHKIKVVQDE